MNPKITLIAFVAFLVLTSALWLPPLITVGLFLLMVSAVSTLFGLVVYAIIYLSAAAFGGKN